MPPNETVVVLGASPKRQRHSNETIRTLLQYGHRVIPVHPLIRVIEGLPVAKKLGQIKENVNTLTLYVNPERGIKLVKDMVDLGPDRVIMNPGAESHEMEEHLLGHGIQVLRA
jgi:predicted CoA-binding protein